jgi:hypothetical protein
MPAGRPSKYKPEFIKQAKKLVMLGATDKQIADFFGISEVTLNAWKKKYPEFLKSLKQSKKMYDERVVRSLWERATGYSHPDVHISNYQGKITITDIIKHYPPDPTSMIFWLKNRDKENWRDKQDVDVSGDLTINIKKFSNGD